MNKYDLYQIELTNFKSSVKMIINVIASSIYGLFKIA